MTTKVNGDTGVSQCQPNSVSQDDLAANVVGKGPIFRATSNANQAVTTGVITKVTLQVEDFDSDNCFSSSRFTPTVAGYYQVNGIVRLSADVPIDSAFAYIYKNGVAIAQGGFNDGTTPQAASKHPTVSDVVFLNGTTDYVELFGLVASATNPRFEGTAGVGSAKCVFSASLVRAA